jgi:hypothetical protein
MLKPTQRLYSRGTEKVTKASTFRTGGSRPVDFELKEGACNICVNLKPGKNRQVQSELLRMITDEDLRLPPHLSLIKGIKLFWSLSALIRSCLRPTKGSF